MPQDAAEVGIESIQQAGATRPAAILDLFDDQLRRFEYGQVLADGVVVETDERGELGDTDRSSGICDVPEDPMARRIAECPGFPLDLVGHRAVRPLARSSSSPYFSS